MSFGQGWIDARRTTECVHGCFESPESAAGFPRVAQRGRELRGRSHAGGAQHEGERSFRFAGFEREGAEQKQRRRLRRVQGQRGFVRAARRADVASAVGKDPRLHALGCHLGA